MFAPGHWPYAPERLSEIIDEETLAVIEAGSCERLGRPMTIMDHDPATGGFFHRIESKNEKERYAPFCCYLRNDKYVPGGDEACKQWDILQARRSLQVFLQTGDPFLTFPCHMGLTDMSHVVTVRGRPVALLLSGQYAPPGDGATGASPGLVSASSRMLTITPETQVLLDALARHLDPAPPDARELLAQEARYIQRIAEAEVARQKRQWEQDFLDRLRRTCATAVEAGHAGLVHTLEELLIEIKNYCGCEYAVYFGSTDENHAVLAPMAQAGLSVPEAMSLPHFNWKKAGLPLEHFNTQECELARWPAEARMRAFRGGNGQSLAGAACIIPTALRGRYRGVLVLGPFADQGVDPQAERGFLTAVAELTSTYALTGLQIEYLDRERSRWHSTANLLVHQLRTGLTPINNEIGQAKALAGKTTGTSTRRVVEVLTKAEDLVLQLAQGAKETVTGHVLQLERDDLEFEGYSLSVLVLNCAGGFTKRAEARGLTLVIGDEVEWLPTAEVDVARLTIALANLIDNAVKYSYPGTTIYVRSKVDWTAGTDRAQAIIEVDNLGYGITPEDQKRIFEQGTRGLVAVKQGNIPGSGLGLWETRAVIRAHGGEIDVRCEPTSIHKAPGRAFHVVFSVKIPLSQNRSAKEHS